MIFNATFAERSHTIKITEDRDGCYQITIDNKEPFTIDVIDKQTGSYSVIYKGKAYEFDVEDKENQYNVLVKGRLYSLELVNQKSTTTKSKETGEQKLTAKMPGKIIKIQVKEGDEVTKGEGIIIMEAMKMENELKAPTTGKVKKIIVKEGQNVDAGADLIFFE